MGKNTSGPEAIPDEHTHLIAVMRLLRKCSADEMHARRVMRISLMLFDGLASLHGYGALERFYLKIAAILHDIGYCRSAARHHKETLAIIRKTNILSFSKRERRIIGNIARYHRKALPKPSHKQYMKLDETARRVVRTLAAFLRIADGLDRSHMSIVRKLKCADNGGSVIITAVTTKDAQLECAKAMQKSDLFEAVFGKRLILDWKLTKKEQEYG
jgi:exopolyphosphatase/guanosine-5'-triphosphate,3'-diphosphate pyrophosphatase